MKPTVKESIIMEPGSSLAREVEQGEILRIEDMEGQQCADIALISRSSWEENKDKRIDGKIPQSLLEQYSQHVTASRNRHIYLGEGFTLFTNLCNPIAVITDDPVGHHDMVSAWCNPETNYARWGEKAVGTGSCKENIIEALDPYDIQISLPASFNIWMDFEVNEDGALLWKEGLSKAGDHIDLTMSMDAIVGISNCPMKLNAVNGFNPSRLRVSVLTADDGTSAVGATVDLGTDVLPGQAKD
jgi:uncharacterized protein